MTKILELEYQCYFKTEESLLLINDSHSHWWEKTYAGCNSQIEKFLEKMGLDSVLEKLGFTHDFIKPVNEIYASELDEVVRKYLIAIGFIYPVDDEKVVVHPNMLFAQFNENRYSGDSPFLSRDLIRGPYVYYDQLLLDFSDQDIWDYWKDLVALSIADKAINPARSFHCKPERKSQEEGIKKQLELGRKLTPQRYIELEPELESFNWIIE